MHKPGNAGKFRRECLREKKVTGRLQTEMPIFKRKVSQLSSEHSEMPILRPSPSITSLKMTAAIEFATIISAEKRNDKKIYYIIEIETQQHQYRMPNKAVTYRIARRYTDFARLSQKLHTRFKTTKLRAGSCLPPKIKNAKLSIFPISKELQNKRYEELNQFLRLLFRKQSIITESSTVLEFFKPRASDKIYATTITLDSCKVEIDDNDEIMIKRMQEFNGRVVTVPTTPTELAPMVIDNAENVNPHHQQQQQQDDRPTQAWKRFRCTSILSRSSTSTSSLSSFCSQAAHKLISPWHHPNHRRQDTADFTASWTHKDKSPSTITGRKSFYDPREYYRTRGKKKRALKKCQSSPGFIIREHPLEERTNNSPRNQYDADSIDLLYISDSQMQESNFTLSSMDPITSHCTTATATIAQDGTNNQTMVDHGVPEEDEYPLIPIIDDINNNNINYNHYHQHQHHHHHHNNNNNNNNKQNIKFKIIYDIDNIVILKAPRTISLVELRRLIMNKFGERHGLNISLKDDSFVLLYNDTNGNCCNARTVLTNEAVLPAKVISKEEDLQNLLRNKWKNFERVALRCILV